MIAVIDEDEDTRRILASYLGSAGFAVVCAAHARDAAVTCTTRPIAVVVSELRGRRVDAASLVEAIRGEPALREAPLIVNTSRVADADRAYARAHGAAAFFTKPTDLRALLRCIWMLVETPSSGVCAHTAGSRRIREDERERTPVAQPTLDVDPPSVPLGDSLCDHEPEPRPAPA
jgi:DNA-binding response OmpR family regulator